MGEGMNILTAANITPGITSIIGSGGKTTCLWSAAHEICAMYADQSGFTQALPNESGKVSRDHPRVILTTTTHFLPFAGIPLVTSHDVTDVERAFSKSSIICLATPVNPEQPHRKFGPSAFKVTEMLQFADYILIEADGSRQLPLKAHNPYEPVIATGTQTTILVVGASGLNTPIITSVHRPERFCELVGCSPDAPATPERVARSLTSECACGALAPTHIIINQADTSERFEQARALGTALSREGLTLPIFAGSFRAHDLTRLS